MKLETPSFPNGGPIPPQFAFCVPAGAEHATFGANRNPGLSWSGAPEGTRSFALVCVDVDAPSKPDDVNQEGHTVPADLPRVDFYHWVLIDLPADVIAVPEGADSDGVTPHGKALGKTDLGVRGRNDYTGWFAGDDAMEGQYGGYDGPCPPWNDEIVHHYHFKVFALDVESLGLAAGFGGAEALAAMEGHVLDQAEWVGTNTLNPALAAG